MNTQTRPESSLPTIQWQHTRPSRTRRPALAAIGGVHLKRFGLAVSSVRPGKLRRSHGASSPSVDPQVSW
jgi:hypothetical protein